MPFSRGSSQLRDQTQVSCIASRFFTTSATWEALFSVVTISSYTPANDVQGFFSFTSLLTLVFF